MAVNSIGNSAWLFNTAGTTTNKQQDSIAKLWSNYTASQQNATGALAGLQEVNANLKSLMASYEDAKSAFNLELGENMDALAASAEKVAGYNFSVKADDAITTSRTTDDDGNVRISSAITTRRLNFSRTTRPSPSAWKIWRASSATRPIAPRITNRSV